MFKKGDNHAMSYMMEHCSFNHLYMYVQVLLHPQRHSYLLNVAFTALSVYHKIGSVSDKGGPMDIIFLDFNKAFDCSSHSFLVHIS